MGKRGFTLIEIIMAMAILAVGVLGVVRLLPVGLRASKSAEMVSKAAFVAQEQMEMLKLSGFNGLSSAILSGEQGEFSWQAEVDNASLAGLSSSAEIKQITLVVSWIERGNTRTQNLTTYIGN